MHFSCVGVKTGALRVRHAWRPNIFPKPLPRVGAQQGCSLGCSGWLGSTGQLVCVGGAGSGWVWQPGSRLRVLQVLLRPICHPQCAHADTGHDCLVVVVVATAATVGHVTPTYANMFASFPRREKKSDRCHSPMLGWLECFLF